MKKIRINELARECEQPNGVIIGILLQFGVTEKKTHSSSIDEDVADRIRAHFRALAEGRAAEGVEGAGPASRAGIGEPPITEAEAALAKAEDVERSSEEAIEPAMPSGPSFSQGLTTEERMMGRPAAHPVRPPLAREGPGSAASRPVLTAKPLPTPRPGQIISGPRQPFPAGTAEGPRPLRAAPPAQAHLPAPANAPAAPPAAAGPRQNLAGQPTARPVVPPRADLVARLAQTKAVPGQPQARSGAPVRPAAMPIPGQPIYKGPIRTGHQFVRTRTTAPGGPAPRVRGLHPTTPLRGEPPAVPSTDQRRAQKDRARVAVDRELDREEKHLRVPMARREDLSKLAEGKQITVAEGITVKEDSQRNSASKRTW